MRFLVFWCFCCRWLRSTFTRINMRMIAIFLIKMVFPKAKRFIIAPCAIMWQLLLRHSIARPFLLLLNIFTIVPSQKQRIFILVLSTKTFPTIIAFEDRLLSFFKFAVTAFSRWFCANCGFKHSFTTLVSDALIRHINCIASLQKSELCNVKNLKND